MSEIIYQSGVSVGLISSVIYAVISPIVWLQFNTDLGTELQVGKSLHILTENDTFYTLIFRVMFGSLDTDLLNWHLNTI